MRSLTLFLFLFLALTSSTIQASHYLGYDMELVNLKDANNNPTDNYKWRMRFYRDVTGIAIPTSITFIVYRTSDNASFGNFVVTKINPQTFITYPQSSCVPNQAQNRVELGIYESPVLNYIALNSTAGYYATASVCCRNPGIINVNGESSNYAGLLYVKFPRLNVGSVTRYNSSPQFNDLPLYGFSVGKLYTADWGTTDPDGDSLVYTLVKALDGGPVFPNFANIEFASGYALGSNLADGDPDFQINSSTGVITYKPTIANRYLVAMKVEEYRKIAGVPTKIGEVRREMQIEAFLPTDLPPVLYDSLANTTVYDTINAITPQIKVLSFLSDDNVNDSVFIKIIPEISATSNNILDTNLIDVRWGDILGNTEKGAAAEGFIIKGKGSTRALLIVNADSTSISAVPYKFNIVSYDQTCFVPLTDTVHYELFIRGNICYTSVTSLTTVCDSFVALNGTTYYQSVTLIDTVLSTVGCNKVYVDNIDIVQSPTATFNNLNIYVTDTAQNYTYKVDTQSNVTYQWYVSANGSILSGANTNEILVKWNIDNNMEEIYCFVFNGSCFDSLISPIVVSHIVGLNTVAVNKITVYPNPVSDVLTFDIKNNLEHANISIYNTLGQMLQQSTLHNNELIVAGLPEGVYQFVLSKGTQQFRGTFIKE